MPFDFDAPALLAELHRLSDSALDALGVGVIAMDAGMLVRRYNLHETQATGLQPERVLGHHLFTDIAQCMNNYLVAQKFVDAQAAGHALDEGLDYVLTWRMKPTPVRLRLLSDPALALQYLLLRRTA
jgi:photoactive yellow protein